MNKLLIYLLTNNRIISKIIITRSFGDCDASLNIHSLDQAVEQLEGKQPLQLSTRLMDFVFLLRIKFVKQNVFSSFIPIVRILFHMFDQNPLFSFNMESLTSQKGKPQLVFNGYIYIIDKNENKIYWNCDRSECPGRAISSKNGDGLPVDAKQTKDHNHAPSGTDVDVKYFVVLLSS